MLIYAPTSTPAVPAAAQSSKREGKRRCCGTLRTHLQQVRVVLVLDVGGEDGVGAAQLARALKHAAGAVGADGACVIEGGGDGVSADMHALQARGSGRAWAMERTAAGPHRVQGARCGQVGAGGPCVSVWGWQVGRGARMCWTGARCLELRHPTRNATAAHLATQPAAPMRSTCWPAVLRPQAVVPSLS